MPLLEVRLKERHFDFRAPVHCSSLVQWHILRLIQGPTAEQPAAFLYLLEYPKFFLCFASFLKRSDTCKSNAGYSAFFQPIIDVIPFFDPPREACIQTRRDFNHSSESPSWHKEMKCLRFGCFQFSETTVS